MSKTLRCSSVFFLLIMLMSIQLYAISAQDRLSLHDCTGLPEVEAGESLHTLLFDGNEREYLLYIPETYDPAQALPLVMSFHGFASNPVQQASFSEWHEYAQELAEEGEPAFITVYPRGTMFPARWNSGLSFGDEFGADDVGYVNALIDHLTETLCIDQSRVYANGLSNGGGMSYRLACELSERITAIGGVAGAYSALPNGCEPSRPVPVIGFHGTEDPIVPYTGGDAGPILAPPVTEWAREWADRNGCALESPATIVVTEEISGVRYTGCEEDAEVVFYTIEGGGHTWPGDEIGFINLVAGTTTQDIDATRVMWAFFERFRLEG